MSRNIFPGKPSPPVRKQRKYIKNCSNQSISKEQITVSVKSVKEEAKSCQNKPTTSIKTGSDITSKDIFYKCGERGCNYWGIAAMEFHEHMLKEHNFSQFPYHCSISGCSYKSRWKNEVTKHLERERKTKRRWNHLSATVLLLQDFEKDCFEKYSQFRTINVITFQKELETKPGSESVEIKKSSSDCGIEVGNQILSKPKPMTSKASSTKFKIDPVHRPSTLKSAQVPYTEARGRTWTGKSTPTEDALKIYSPKKTSFVGLSSDIERGFPLLAVKTARPNVSTRKTYLPSQKKLNINTNRSSISEEEKISWEEISTFSSPLAEETEECEAEVEVKAISGFNYWMCKVPSCAFIHSNADTVQKHLQEVHGEILCSGFSQAAIGSSRFEEFMKLETSKFDSVISDTHSSGETIPSANQRIFCMKGSDKLPETCVLRNFTPVDSNKIVGIIPTAKLCEICSQMFSPDDVKIHKRNAHGLPGPQISNCDLILKTAEEASSQNYVPDMTDMLVDNEVELPFTTTEVIIEIENEPTSIMEPEPEPLEIEGSPSPVSADMIITCNSGHDYSGNKDLVPYQVQDSGDHEHQFIDGCATEPEVNEEPQEQNVNCSTSEEIEAFSTLSNIHEYAKEEVSPCLIGQIQVNEDSRTQRNDSIETYPDQSKTNSPTKGEDSFEVNHCRVELEEGPDKFKIESSSTIPFYDVSSISNTDALYPFHVATYKLRNRTEEIYQKNQCDVNIPIENNEQIVEQFSGVSCDTAESEPACTVNIDNQESGLVLTHKVKSVIRCQDYPYELNNGRICLRRTIELREDFPDTTYEDEMSNDFLYCPVSTPPGSGEGNMEDDEEDKDTEEISMLEYHEPSPGSTCSSTSHESLEDGILESNDGTKNNTKYDNNEPETEEFPSNMSCHEHLADSASPYIDCTPSDGVEYTEIEISYEYKSRDVNTEVQDSEQIEESSDLEVYVSEKIEESSDLHSTDQIEELSDLHSEESETLVAIANNNVSTVMTTIQDNGSKIVDLMVLSSDGEPNPKCEAQANSSKMEINDSEGLAQHNISLEKDLSETLDHSNCNWNLLSEKDSRTIEIVIEPEYSSQIVIELDDDSDTPEIIEIPEKPKPRYVRQKQNRPDYKKTKTIEIESTSDSRNEKRILRNPYGTLIIPLRKRKPEIDLQKRVKFSEGGPMKQAKDCCPQSPELSVSASSSTNLDVEEKVEMVIKNSEFEVVTEANPELETDASNESATVLQQEEENSQKVLIQNEEGPNTSDSEPLENGNFVAEVVVEAIQTLAFEDYEQESFPTEIQTKTAEPEDKSEQELNEFIESCWARRHEDFQLPEINCYRDLIPGTPSPKVLKPEKLRCNQCPFQTEDKPILLDHLVYHAAAEDYILKPTETRCDFCSFVCKAGNMINHRSWHFFDPIREGVEGYIYHGGPMELFYTDDCEKRHTIFKERKLDYNSD